MSEANAESELMVGTIGAGTAIGVCFGGPIGAAIGAGAGIFTGAVLLLFKKR